MPSYSFKAGRAIYGKWRVIESCRSALSGVPDRCFRFCNCDLPTLLQQAILIRQSANTLNSSVMPRGVSPGSFSFP